jgi:hypothetical protein
MLPCADISPPPIGETAGETIPIGGAGLLVAHPHEHSDTVEPAVRRAIQKAFCPDS